jgi:23S rRNA pseudouridine2605 synthase
VRVPHDRIEVDGSPLGKAPPVYLAMNKPRGIVTTASDEKGRETVYDLLDPGLPWVSPVGRLDKASEGLLLLTNDSEWAAKIAEPVSHLEKKYHVQVDCVADDRLISKLIQRTADGAEDLGAKFATLLRRGDKTSWIEITLDEGKNRQIRRLLQAQEIGVLRLVRVSIGPLALGHLKKRQVRELTVDEKKALDQALRIAARR